MGPKYILNYFDFPGRGESIRLMFHAAGVEFEDNRITNWPEVKDDKTRFPLGAMPTLQVDDKVICQSNAINRYVANELGMYGDNSYEKALIDQVCETIVDISSAVIPIVHGKLDEETKKAKFAEFFASETFKKQMTFINSIVKNNGNGFCAGKKLSMADFIIFTYVRGLQKVNPQFADDLAEIKELCAKIQDNERIKKYLQSRAQ